MRWLLIIPGLLVVALFAAYKMAISYPGRTYHAWINQQKWNRYYTIENFKPLFLKSPGITEIGTYQEDFEQLWKNFPLRNSLIPLPIRHPLFLTFPIIEMRKKGDTPQVGISISNPNGREISRVYTLPTGLYQDHSQSQELFRLPYFRKKIQQYQLDQVWQDVFSKEIDGNSKGIDNMLYDLYILHLRSKLLPAETIRYGLLKEGKQALVELSSRDKDYMIELVLSQQNGNIYSYVLRTEKENKNSQILRSKFLQTISFTPIDQAMGRVLYTEFKSLNFARQVEQEGMQHLFAAWSQDIDNIELLKELIFYLERGKRTSNQLQPIYRFTLLKYGKTFTTRSLFSEAEDPAIALQRKIEIESMEKRLQMEKGVKKIPDNPELTPEEKMNLYLKRAKEADGSDKDEMTIH